VTQAERDRAIAYLEETKADILNSTATLSEAQWRMKPSAEAWSPADCVEHLAIVEAHLLRQIQDLAKGPAAAEEVLAATPGKEDVIVKLVPSRGRKVTAPEGARPANRFPNADELRAHFTEVRDRTILYVRTTKDPIRQRAFNHMIFGPLDGYQWIIFCGAHTERHRKQLEEALASA